MFLSIKHYILSQFLKQKKNAITLNQNCKIKAENLL